jgi:hypothetical protein
MDLTEGSETSAKLNLTPGKYPKEHIQDNSRFSLFCERAYQSVTCSVILCSTGGCVL